MRYHWYIYIYIDIMVYQNSVIKFETQAFHPRVVAWSLSPILAVLLSSRRIWRAVWHNQAVRRVLQLSYSSKYWQSHPVHVIVIDCVSLYVSRCLCLSLRGWFNLFNFFNLFNLNLVVFCHREAICSRKHVGSSKDPAVLKWLDAAWEPTWDDQRVWFETPLEKPYPRE